MKILGHAYIATQAVKGNKELLIIGSLLPEVLPYLPGGIFKYQELHEGGKRLLEYLDKNYPEKRDLALGLLSHGVEFGADQFRPEIEKSAVNKKRLLVEKIAQAHRINLESAEARVHNYLGLGIDWLLIQNEPKLVEEIQEALRNIDVGEISRLLAEAFDKNEVKVRVMMKTLFKEIYQPEDLTSAEGLARIWVRQVKKLPEGERVDVQKAGAIIQKCAELLKMSWKNLLESMVVQIAENLKPFAFKGRFNKNLLLV